MLATDDPIDEENECAEKSSSQRPRSISGDDLGDSFLVDNEPRTKKGWVAEILERRDADDNESEEDDSSEDFESAEDGSDEEESDEDNDEREEYLSMKDWERSDDDSLETDLGAEEEEEIEENDEDDDVNENKKGRRESEKAQNINAVESSKSHKDSSNSKKLNADGKLPSAQLELPYLIEAPKSLEELFALLDNCSNADIILIINRIRASNAIKLAAENRKKMQV